MATHSDSIPSVPTHMPGMGMSVQYMIEGAHTTRISSDGEFTGRCEALLAEMLSCQRVFLTNSGTSALIMATLLAGIGPGDEVITPSFTFPSVANAIMLCGAKPVWIDIRRDTLNLDATLLDEVVTPATAAIVPMHYAGIGCAMNEIVQFADAHNVLIIEDNAHGLCGMYRGQPLGTFGDLAALSFHETKNFSAGEGGALVISNDQLTERAELISRNGTDRHRFLRGEVDRYTWRDIGASFGPSDLIAGYLLGQLEQRSMIQARRTQVWNRYAASLVDWAGVRCVTLPTVPDGVVHPAHLFYLLMPSSASRIAFTSHMLARGIAVHRHYIPLHSSPLGQRLFPSGPTLPVTDSVADCLIRLPLSSDMGDADVDEVVDAVLDFQAT